MAEHAALALTSSQLIAQILNKESTSQRALYYATTIFLDSWLKYKHSFNYDLEEAAKIHHHLFILQQHRDFSTLPSDVKSVLTFIHEDSAPHLTSNPITQPPSLRKKAQDLGSLFPEDHYHKIKAQYLRSTNNTPFNDLVPTARLGNTTFSTFNQFSNYLFSTHTHTLIVGETGSGKTHLLESLTYESATRMLPDTGIPTYFLFISLEKLAQLAERPSSFATVAAMLHHYFIGDSTNAQGIELALEQLLFEDEILDASKMILLLDSYAGLANQFAKPDSLFCTLLKELWKLPYIFTSTTPDLAILQQQGFFTSPACVLQLQGFEALTVQKYMNSFFKNKIPVALKNIAPHITSHPETLALLCQYGADKKENLNLFHLYHAWADKVFSLEERPFWHSSRYPQVAKEASKKERLPVTLSLQANEMVHFQKDVTKLFINHTTTFAAAAAVSLSLVRNGLFSYTPISLSAFFEFLLAHQNQTVSPKTYDYGMLLLVAWNELLQSDPSGNLVESLRDEPLKDTRFLKAETIIQIDTALNMRISTEKNKNSAFLLLLKTCSAVAASLQRHKPTPVPTWRKPQLHPEPTQQSLHTAGPPYTARLKHK